MVKVGLLDTLGSRHLRFWEPYLQDLGVEVLRPTLPKDEAYRLGQDSLGGEPPYVQLALGRILELERADIVLLPQLDTVAGDPWSEAFVDVLRSRVSSLPTLTVVPAGGDAAATAATELGARLTHNPGMIGRALDRHRPRLTPPRESMPALTAASRHTFAVIGPDVLLAEPFLTGHLTTRLDEAGVHAVYGTDVPRDVLLERGLRSGAATPGERALAGAQLALEGKSAVRGLLFVVPARSDVYRRLADRLAATARKPALVLDVAPEREDFADLDAFVSRTVTGVSARPAGGDE